MASAENNTDSAEMADGSDEIEVEMFCENCEKEKGTIELADGFCVECKEYMCTTCSYYHRKYMRDHTLQDKTAMPQDFCKEKCSIHPKEIIKYFCKSCDNLACPECLTNDHVQCSCVCYIPTLVQDTENSDHQSDDLKELQEKINSLSDDLAAVQDDINYNIKEMNANGLETLSDIKKHEENVKRQLKSQSEQIIHDIEKTKKEAVGKLEREIEELVKKFDQEKKDKIQWLDTQQALLNDQIDKAEESLSCENMNKTDTQNLQILSSKANSLEGNLTEVRKVINKTQKEGSTCLSFVAIKKAKQEVMKTEKEIGSISNENDISYIAFESAGDKTDINTKCADFNFGCLKEKSNVKRKIERRGIISLNNENNITGICQVFDSTLVAVGEQPKQDGINRQLLLESGFVTLIDALRNKVIYALSVFPIPFDVTAVNANQIAVTLPTEGSIQFVNITRNNELEQDHAIKAGVKCYGIVSKKPNVIVSYTHPPQVKILSLDGTVLQTFHKDSNGKNMFISPNHMVLSPNHKILYINDGSCIKSMNFEGKLINAHNCEGTRLGLTTDQAGTVYTTDNYNTVCQLSADLNTVHRLFKGYYSTASSRCLLYNKKGNFLYVVGFLPTSPSCGINVYKIK